MKRRDFDSSTRKAFHPFMIYSTGTGTRTHLNHDTTTSIYSIIHNRFGCLLKELLS